MYLTNCFVNVILFNFVLGILLSTAHSALPEKYQQIVIGCYKENGYDGRPLDYFDPAVPNNFKCALACILEKKGFFKEDGSIDKVKFGKDMEEVIEDQDGRNRYLKAVDRCDPKARANNCETAYEFTKCVNT
ncbi:unnamed protein product [Nezara viridula]|uniref:Uncharacterized protein n=1 Tax=Nezara viridula TaxID=85310 RepID=A0A9P0H3P6_NEZVI|nr:unnamed protein product [Nezara viridula]